MIHPLVFGAIAQPHPLPYTLTLSNTSIVAVTSTKVASAKLKIDTDGNVYGDEDTGAGYVQLFTTTNWVRPVDQTSNPFECRITNITGNTPTSTAAEDVWHVISTGDYEVILVDGVSDGTGRTCTFNIEIRRGSSGDAEVSAEYTLYAEYS